MPLKIRRLGPGLNPRTWVLKASTPPLDHRSRDKYMYLTYYVDLVGVKEVIDCKIARSGTRQNNVTVIEITLTFKA